MPFGAKRVKLREPFEYFVDRSLGRQIVVEGLRAAGETAHAHDDFFARGTPDGTWLSGVGRRRWVVLTKDKDIRRNALEYRAVLEAKAACFMLGRGDLSAPTMTTVFVRALPLIRRALRRFHVPLAASLSVGGHIRVRLPQESGSHRQRIFARGGRRRRPASRSIWAISV